MISKLVFNYIVQVYENTTCICINFYVTGKQKEIEKIFSNCEERLRVYQQELEEADKEEM